MNKKEMVISSIFALLGSFFLALLLFLGVSKFTLMNPDYLLATMDKVEYYQGIHDKLTEEFKQTAGAAGFDPAIYDDFLDIADIKKEANHYIREYFSKSKASVDQEAFKEKLTAHLQKVITEQNLSNTKEDQDRLETYININVQGYVKYLQFPFIQYIDMAITMMNRVFYFVLASCAVLFAVALVLLLKMRIDKEKKIFFTSSLTIASGLMVSVLPLGIIIGQYINKIKLEPEYFYHFFTNYLEGYLGILSVVGMLMIVGSIVTVYVLHTKMKKAL